jgi:glyoxylase-like metal-dependent hydrolase (beta-lactamase superfamily II)
MSDNYEIRRCVVGPIGTNCYLVMNKETQEMLLVDPGDDSGRIEETIRKMGGTPKTILLTHGHSDHIMAVEAVLEAYPGICVLAGQGEKKMFADHSLNSSFDSREYSFIPDAWLKDGDVLEKAGLRIEVLETPGHTAGSVCYYLPEEEILFSGDTLFRESCGRTDLQTGSDGEMQNSLHKIFERIPDGVRVCPGHMAMTTIAHEKEFNPYA